MTSQTCPKCKAIPRKGRLTHLLTCPLRPEPKTDERGRVLRNVRGPSRLASMRWCPSCQDMRPTLWDECETCGAQLTKHVAKTQSHVQFKAPSGTMTKVELLALFNTSGMFRPRYDYISVGPQVGDVGERDIVPHTTECPGCKRRQIAGMYKVEYTDGHVEIELACTQCASWTIPRRLGFGVPVVATVGCLATVVCVASDAWKVESTMEG